MTSSRKGIFIDMDGVFAEYRRPDPLVLDPTPISRLNDLVAKDPEHTDVILSSSWRLREDGLDKAQTALRKYGYNGPDLICLPKHYAMKHLLSGSSSPYCDVGPDVLGYLSEHPEITHYVIFDDSRDTLEWVWDHVVYIHDRITEEDAFLASEILKENPTPEESVRLIAKQFVRDAYALKHESCRNSVYRELHALASVRPELAEGLRAVAEKALRGELP